MNINNGKKAAGGGSDHTVNGADGGESVGGDSVGDISLGTLDTDMEAEAVEHEVQRQQKKAKKEAYQKAREEWEAAMKAKERFNFFPFKWKYPNWAVKYLGLSNKKKKKEVKI